MMKKRLTLGLALLLLVGLVIVPAAAAKVTDLILATTTSTVDTGLLDFLIPKFEAQTGYKVKPIGVGTGQALAMGEKGEADVLLTHAPASERPLVEKGLVTDYRLVMHNDFVIVGPAADPAKIKGTKLAAEAMKKIAATGALFVSRGDDSGTHKMEKSLWKKADLKPGGTWYQEAGAGMGQTLLIASEKDGYTLTDRGTYLAQKKNLRLTILVEGDKDLLNIYHVMAVNQAKFAKVNAEGARAFVEFMVSPAVQKIIGEFGKDKYGAPLFFPDAGKNVDDLGK
jgi:tungstate transport system substrate-binding protein